MLGVGAFAFFILVCMLYTFVREFALGTDDGSKGSICFVSGLG